MHVIILAGGIGARLWPWSKETFPKQFLHLGGKDSLLKQTVLRVMSKSSVKTIIVSTSIPFEKLVRKELEGMNVDILVEPCSRNTGPAIAFSILHLQKEHRVDLNEPILVLPSDHFIAQEEILFEYFLKGIEAAKAGYIVAFGIQPTRPETGYGYIRIGEKFDSVCYYADEFVEKPNSNRAMEYIANPSYYWNSGMFAFTANTFWSESAIHYPQVASLESEYASLKAISIDYALMEKSKRVVLCPLPVFWSDVGSWENVYEMLEKDADHNVKLGKVVSIDTKNCLIFGGKRIISTLGLDDLVIIDTEDTLLIARKSDSQRVRELSEKCASSL